MMDLMSFLSDEEWETVTEPLMEGKANIYPRTAFHRGGEGEIPTNHILPQGKKITQRQRGRAVKALDL